MTSRFNPRIYDPVPVQDPPTPELKSSSVTSTDHQGRRFPITNFLTQCVIPPLLGLSFVTLGLYIHYDPNPIVISHSTENAALISQGFTALFAVWHFFALLPVLSAVYSVRSEEWWRRLLQSTTFKRANSVSSNISGNVAHMMEMFRSRSSPYYKIAWVAAIIAVVLADIAPAAIHVQVGLIALDNSFSVPALPPNSIYSDYSKPFAMSNYTLHTSVEIAPMYINSQTFTRAYVTAQPSVFNALIPRPNIFPGQGYRYLTDVAFMTYECDWYAPEVAEPDTMSDITAQNLSMTIGDLRGLGFAPFFESSIYLLSDYTNASTREPSFSGHVAFVVTSGIPPPGYGYLNLSTVPTYTLSAAWKAAAAAYRANQTGLFEPPDSLSVMLCSPKYSLEPWAVELVNGTVNLVELQSQTVGNLDPLQLQIAAQDCFNFLPKAPPILPNFGVSDTVITWLFAIDGETQNSGTPESPTVISPLMNGYLANSLQAYLDNYAFGNFTPSNSKLLVPAVVVLAQLDFLLVAAALYTLLSFILLSLFIRPPAHPLTIRSVLDATQDVPPNRNAVRGEGAAVAIEQIAIQGQCMDDAEKERRVNYVIGDLTAAIRDSLPGSHPFLEINSTDHSTEFKPLLEYHGNVRLRFAWMVTPALGSTLVGFGIAAYVRPRIVGPPQGSRDIIFSALFTWAIGLWRSVSLVGIHTMIHRANSEEWSHHVRSTGFGLNERLRLALNEISTNKLSALDAFCAAWMAKTSIFFKVSYIAALLASLCAVIAQGAVTLLTLPASIDNQLAIPILAHGVPIPVPWSGDETLAPENAGIIESAKLATSFVYLEQVIGATLLDALPLGYIVPSLGASSNNTGGSRYPTDVAHVQCNCTWVAPILPIATANVSYIPISLEEFGISALQTVPSGVATFAPLSNMTFSSNSTPVTSGVFAWTLWGGGPGDPVNLDSVPYTTLSNAWQKLIIDEFAPAYLDVYSSRTRYMTNLTRASTLVCDPNIQITTQTARAFGGFLELEKAPAKFETTGVGNVDKDYIAFTIYSYAVQQAQEIIGVFRPYLVFGLVMGNAIMDADPLNPVSGTVPKSPGEIASKLDVYIGSEGKSWSMPNFLPNSTVTVDGQLIQLSTVVTAALPQIIAAGVLYLILGVAAFIISLRPPGTPFTLAGILMMRSKLVTLGLSWGNVEGAEEKYDSTEPTSEAMRHQLSPSRIREIDESESDGQ